MIPVALHGVDIVACDEFFASLPDLLEQANITDVEYEEMLYRIEGELSLRHIHMINDWLGKNTTVWGSEVTQEVLTALNVIRYPDVTLVESLLSIEHIDCVLLSNWLHFLTRVYPIYDGQACAGLAELGLDVAFDAADITSYGRYVSLIEGLKEHAPAGALPEYALPRQRLLQVGLARWATTRAG